MNPDFLHELKKYFTGDLRFDSASRVLYSTDASMYQIEPLGVAIPKTQDDLHAAVELAAKYKIPILPRGAGSSLGGQAIGEALILDCSRHLDSIIEIDSASQTATVEPGVVLAALNSAAAKFGLMFGPDPASAERATMGGVIGNNATGAHSILYGMTADHLISADVILSDGSLTTWGEANSEFRNAAIISAATNIREKYAEAIKQNFPKSWRNSAGYRINYLLPWSPSAPPQWANPENRRSVYDKTFDLQPSTFNLAPLLAGSEGTLAIIRRAKVNLVRKPKYTILGVLAYESIAASCDDVPRLLEFNPSAIELIPQLIIRLARGVSTYAREMSWMVGDPAALLVVEFSGDDPQKIKEQVQKIGDILVVAESREDQARVWNIRKMGLGILDSRPQSARPAAFIEDCAVPVENLGEFVREVEKILNAHHVEGGIYAHASGGCLHIRPILDLLQGEGVRALRSIGEQVFALTTRLGGSMSSEHGDGIVAGEWIEKTYGAEIAEAMRALKRAADPDNILNPHKMLDAPPMDTHLRYGENYRAQAWKPALHFDHARGFAGAIEQCNGQGVCRKTTGVMCPSFQATREEGNSTRGRANLLRSLITNRRLPITDVFHALDLCLACKGCASECPSGVDMPKLKYEFMNEYFKTHRRPLRDYLFGYFHVVSKYLSPAAPLANAFMQTNWSRKIIARAAGITEKRPFPVYSKQAGRHTHKLANAKNIVFLSDVFSRYLEPEVEQAAFDILRAAGYNVEVLPIVGAGTSLLSKGFIRAARAHAKKILDAIKLRDAESNLSVVGCEPPEVYCLKHEYAALIPERRAEIESLGRRVWLMDEFILRNVELEKLISRNVEKEKIIFHPHCHQRAEGLADDGLPSGTSATVAMLRACGFNVEVMDTGCCGMAGAFGYDAEHYDLSMQVGELKLFPKLREADATTKVVSSGSACRLQIKHGAQKTAEHPLVLIAKMLM
ncbi:MAG: FAD-linked oxidase C-terminal domain-containing protein [Anaerolineales bacterium]|nr:FAD-linked oxidase C-terminal domain-containing protein [Anaerolineales bacterium]